MPALGGPLGVELGIATVMMSPRVCLLFQSQLPIIVSQLVLGTIERHLVLICQWYQSLVYSQM